MADRKIYTRAYSSSSAGRLTSGKGPEGTPLSHTDLLREFKNHAVKQNREPTALVSCSDRIIDTLRRAFKKYYEDHDAATEIWIAFVEIPPTEGGIHAARKLADECSLPRSYLFSREFVFEWAIPKKYVLHEVSLQTLFNRGLPQDSFSEFYIEATKRDIVKDFRTMDPWEMGVSFGSFAQKFGARAPLEWISYRLFYDCVRMKIVGDDLLELRYADNEMKEYEDFDFGLLLEEGINASLCDGWLKDGDLCQDYEEFKEYRNMMEDNIIDDLTEFWETWHEIDCDGTIKKLSTKEHSAYVVAKEKLLAEHERMRVAVEAEAVEIGL